MPITKRKRAGGRNKEKDDKNAWKKKMNKASILTPEEIADGVGQKKLDVTHRQVTRIAQRGGEDSSVVATRIIEKLGLKHSHQKVLSLLNRGQPVNNVYTFISTKPKPMLRKLDRLGLLTNGKIDNHSVFEQLEKEHEKRWRVEGPTCIRAGIAKDISITDVEKTVEYFQDYLKIDEAAEEKFKKTSGYQALMGERFAKRVERMAARNADMADNETAMEVEIGDGDDAFNLGDMTGAVPAGKVPQKKASTFTLPLRSGPN